MATLAEAIAKAEALAPDWRLFHTNLEGGRTEIKPG
jgi:hypothetical protein